MTSQNQGSKYDPWEQGSTYMSPQTQGLPGPKRDPSDLGSKYQPSGPGSKHDPSDPGSKHQPSDPGSEYNPSLHPGSWYHVTYFTQRSVKGKIAAVGKSCLALFFDALFDIVAHAFLGVIKVANFHAISDCTASVFRLSTLFWGCTVGAHENYAIPGIICSVFTYFLVLFLDAIYAMLNSWLNSNT